MRVIPLWHDEADGDVGSLRAGQLLAQVGHEGVVLAARDEAALLWGGSRQGGEVVAFPGDDVADAAAGVGHVAFVARDEVEVEVEDGLASGPSDVQADVVAVGVVAVGHEVAGPVEGGEDGRALLVARVEPGGDVAPGDDEEMAGGHGEGVPEGASALVFEGDAVPGWEAEGAGGFGLVGGGGHGWAWARPRAGVISRRPGRPAATQAAQRQPRTGRLAGREAWQTGHQWS